MNTATAIEVENIGSDIYILRARGHHDLHEFMKQVRKEGYEWPLGMPQHLYMRTTPTRKPGYSCWYSFAKEGERGAYPVTYVTEGYGAETYEALVAAAAAAVAMPNSKLIGVVEVQRDADGWWTHPGIPDFDEGQGDDYRAWIEAQGLVLGYELLEHEDDDHPSYVDYFENSGANVSAWHPTPPDGDGWFTISIHDTEDGPVFVWARRIPAVVGANHGE